MNAAVFLPGLKSTPIALLLIVGLAMLPLAGQAPNSPIREHLVGTVLGEPETLGVSDTRTEADFADIADFAFLPNGDMLIADRGQHRVLRIAADGIVRPFAGTGEAANSGDGGAAREAAIFAPHKLAVDGAGTVFITHGMSEADLGGIRKVTIDGKIEAVAGGGTRMPSGSNAPFCADEGITATSLRLEPVEAVAAAETGDLFVKLRSCGAIYRIAAGENSFVRYAGQPNPGSNWNVSLGSLKIALPAAQALMGQVAAMVSDGKGGLIVADRQNGFVFRINAENVALLMAGIKGLGVREGPALGVTMAGLNGLALLPGGGVAISRGFLSSGSGNEIGILSLDGDYQIVTTSDGFHGRPAPLHNGNGVSIAGLRAASDGSIHVIDFLPGSILRMGAPGAFSVFAGRYRAGNGDGNVVIPGDTAPVFRTPFVSNVVSDAGGNLFLIATQRLYRLSPSGALVHVAGTGETGPFTDGQPPLSSVLGFSGSLAIDGASNLYWSTYDSSIRKFSTAGVLSTVVGGGADTVLEQGKVAKTIRLSALEAWTVSPSGQVFFEERGVGSQSARIWRVPQDGLLNRHVGTLEPGQPASPDGKPPLDAFLGDFGVLAVDVAGTLYFTAPQFSSIWRVSSTNTIEAVATNEDRQATPQDGTSTATAPAAPWRNFQAIESDTLLISAGLARALASYAVGGNVTVWRAANEGTVRADGLRLKDDLFVDSSAVTIMPDGGLAWVERNQTQAIVRRSFPVPDGCSYSLPGDEIPVSGGNVLTQVNLTAGADCPWAVGSSANWIEILSKRFGIGPATIQIRALANPSPVERAAVLRVAGRELLVRQAPSTRSDIFAVSPISAVLPPTGGSVEVTVSASPSLTWQVALPSVPVTLSGPAAGTGSGSFTVTLPALPIGTTEQSAVLFVNDRSVTLRQSAAAAPVAVTISASKPGQTATINLVNRPLPYTSQWLPGSVHYVEASGTTRVGDNTLTQFQGWSDDPSQASSRFLVAPAAAATISAQYRTLHAVRARSRLATAPLTIQPLFDRQGVAVPPELAPGAGTAGESALWFPEGGSVSLLAPEESNARFTSFSGSVSGSANPATFTVMAPVDVTANYAEQPNQQPAYRIGGAGRWWFAGQNRTANAAQLSVESLAPAALPQPSVFVSYANTADSPRWLSVRRSNPAAPLSLEVLVDPQTPPGAPLGDASVYLHQPGFRTVKTTATASVRSLPDGNAPWISALTDAGGFRQSLSDTGADFPFVVAPGMILTVFGLNFGTDTLAASSVPLPTSLGGVSVEYQLFDTDPWASSPLFFVSPGQINFQVSPNAVAGFPAGLPIRFRVRTGPTTVSEPWAARLRPRSISLFSADSSGGGAPAGFFVRVLPNQTQQRGDLFLCNSGACSVQTVSFGGSENQIFLELFGSGFRNAGAGENIAVWIGGLKAEVTFAGPHPVFVGLDQLNVKVPPEVPRGVALDLYVWVRNGENPWMVSNRLTVRFE